MNKAKQTISSLRELLKAVFEERRSLTKASMSETIAPYISFRTIKKGERIIQISEKMQTILLVTRGSASFCRIVSRGNSYVLSNAKAPFSIGILQLVLNRREYDSQIVACSNCQIISIDSNYFLEEMKKDGEVSVIVVQDICRILDQVHKRIEKDAFLDAENALMLYISEFWDEHKGEVRDRKLLIKEQRTFLAANLGVSIRTLYRSIAQLKKQGVIGVRKRGEIFVDEDQIGIMREKLKQMK